MKCRIVILVCLLFLSSCNSRQPLNTGNEAWNVYTEFNHTLPALLHEKSISAISIAFIQNGKMEPLHYAGIQDIGRDVSGDTIYPAGSLGKPVFAHLVLKLSDAGLFDIDTPLYDIAPDLVPRKTPALKTVNARMILNHSSGLPNYGEPPIEDLIFKPGTKFHYSGIGYDWLQQVVERHTRRSLETLAQVYVLEPFEMTSSSFVPDEFLVSNFVAKGFDKKLAQTAGQLTRSMASSSFLTTPKDYAKFLLAIDGVAAMRSEICDTPKICWGLGWGIQNTKPKSIWHWGSLPGYRSFVVYYPEEKLGAIVLSNSENLFKVIPELIRITIGGSLPAYDWF